jgi:hypothetical protein
VFELAERFPTHAAPACADLPFKDDKNIQR